MKIVMNLCGSLYITPMEGKSLKLGRMIKETIVGIQASTLLKTTRILERLSAKLYLSKCLRKAKGMTEKEIGQILAAQLLATTRNREHSYVSSVGAQYSHLTEDGKRLMLELVEVMFGKAVTCEQERIKNAAEQMMIDALKK